MNYRHAFHAGNFADVVKHVVLTRILCHLRRKDTAFRVIDTHAGIGLYDLDGPQSGRTLEWQDGIGRLEAPLDAASETLLAPYRAVVADIRGRYGPAAYPGSPAIVRELLRPQDRAIAVEKHPEDCEALKARFVTAAHVKVLNLDGWVALGSLVPPRERRGLVLVDPPYEEPGELDRTADALARAWSKWRTGIYLVWYPIKEVAPIDRFARTLSARVDADMLRLDLLIDRPDDPGRLNGCGLLAINPPYTLADEAEVLLPALSERLARSGQGAFRIETTAPRA